MFVNIALNIPKNKLFTYEIPADLRASIDIGKRVFVPFGRRKRTGFIVEVMNSCHLEKIKPISEIIDDEPLFSKHDLEFYQWLADYFIYPLGKTLAEIIPAGPERKDFLWIKPLPLAEGRFLHAAQKKLLEFLQQYPEGISLSSIIKITGRKNATQILLNMQKAGLLQIKEKQKKQLTPKMETIVTLSDHNQTAAKLTASQSKVIACLQDRGTMALNELIHLSGTSRESIKRLRMKGFIEFSVTKKNRSVSIQSLLSHKAGPIILNNQQEKALQEIVAQLRNNIFTPILLHGITGSGKTEVYLQAIAHTLKNDGAAIYLVPEISLTPQLISRIQGRFHHEEIAVLHSGISNSIRYDQWRQIKEGKIHLVIGARSALFAPLPKLKLIIVDEEHDASYKQDDRLCYHARDLAVLKAKMTGAVVVLGSATPSIRSYYNTRIKKYRYLELSQRVEEKPLPEVKIIDMKVQQDTQNKSFILSNDLISATATALSNREQTLLFLNRRGFDTFLICADCGYNFHCPNCSVSLKNHPLEAVLKCHYCDYTLKAQSICPSCRGTHILSYGIGTQKLEAEIRRIFPEARVARIDSDVTSIKGTQEKILQKLAQREIDIMVGTQVITKGHDFPFITLVGVISADTSLNIPDFRAAERTFQQLTQVAGRGGRGSAPGKVIIQTFNPRHYVLKHVQNQDYKSFYEEEIAFRKELQYPPFSRIINLRFSATTRESLREFALQLGTTTKILNEQHGNLIEIIGPAEAPLAKIKGRYRWQMLLKGEDLKVLHQLAKKILQKSGKSTAKVSIDVDPENFM